MFLFEVLQPLSPDLFWILCVAFGIAFLLAFSVGANDVSNSFGTSVGSRVLTVTQACILATIFEMSGATLLGYSVCDTFRRKMYDVSQYDGAQRELMLGALACLIGSATWNLIATGLKMPISGTHSIVGATIGFSVVLRGWDSIRWTDMIRIVISWFASPLLSGFISSLIYTMISKTIICKIDSLRHGLKALPLFYGATIFINVASVVIDGPEVLGLNLLPWYAGLFIALLGAIATICCVAMILVPKLKREIIDEIVAHRQQGKSPPSRFNYDNPTFTKADEQNGKKGEVPTKPRRSQQADSDELVIDVKKLPSSGQQSAVDRDEKRPPVAPKPAHLRRQEARDDVQSQRRDDNDNGTFDKQQQQFDEIDLSMKQPSRGQAQPTLPIDIDPKQPGGGKNANDHLFSCGERYEIARLFSSLQILTACFASFAHGTNDVSNAVAPLIPIWNIYSSGQEDIHVSTQIWILAFGSIGICTGLWAWGRAVMSTISDGLTKITPSKGFSVELGAAISVLVATKLGLPISTTHCKVGSLVIVGFVSQKFLSQDKLFDSAAVAEQQQRKSSGSPPQQLQLEIIDDKAQEGDDEDGVDWKMFGNIAITWISTVPLAAMASAGVMYIFKWLLL